MSNTADKYRYFAFLAYPESMPGDWKERLALSGVRALAVLHDSDLSDDPVKRAAGVLKKAHWHIEVDYGATTTRRRMESFALEIGGAKHVEVLVRPESYARYLIHDGYPDKHQYSPSDVLEFGGAVYEEMRVGADERVASAGLEVLRLAEREGIRGYIPLLKAARSESPELVNFIVKNTYFCKEVVAGVRGDDDRDPYRSGGKGGRHRGSVRPPYRSSGSRP